MREKVNTIVPDKLRDVLITRTAIKTLKSEDTIEKIISHQFRSARDAFKLYSEVEVSGFGKFMVSERRLRKRIGRCIDIIFNIEKRLEDKDLPDWRRQQFEMRLIAMNNELEYLKTKRDED